jgi:hypothetical protein
MQASVVYTRGKRKTGFDLNIAVSYEGELAAVVAQLPPHTLFSADAETGEFKSEKAEGSIEMSVDTSFDADDFEVPVILVASS